MTDSLVSVDQKVGHEQGLFKHCVTSLVKQMRTNPSSSAAARLLGALITQLALPSPHDRVADLIEGLNSVSFATQGAAAQLAGRLGPRDRAESGGFGGAGGSNRFSRRPDGAQAAERRSAQERLYSLDLDRVLAGGWLPSATISPVTHLHSVVRPHIWRAVAMHVSAVCSAALLTGMACTCSFHASTRSSAVIETRDCASCMHCYEACLTGDWELKTGVNSCLPQGMTRGPR